MPVFFFGKKKQPTVNVGKFFKKGFIRIKGLFISQPKVRQLSLSSPTEVDVKLCTIDGTPLRVCGGAMSALWENLRALHRPA